MRVHKVSIGLNFPLLLFLVWLKELPKAISEVNLAVRFQVWAANAFQVPAGIGMTSRI